MRTWVNVAELTKTKTLTGGLVARSAPGLPFLLSEGVQVAFVPPQWDAPRQARVVSVQDQGRGAYLVTFDTVDSIDLAQKLVGCCCLMKREDVPAAEACFEGEALVGFAVTNQTEGFIGEVSELIINPGQTLLQVQRPEGQQVLIPLVDEFLLDWNQDEGTLLMDLPAGLLDL